MSSGSDGCRDRLEGDPGRNLLIGGLGAIRLVGNAGDDLLIAGTTDYAQRAAERAIRPARSKVANGYSKRTQSSPSMAATWLSVKLWIATYTVPRKRIRE